MISIIKDITDIFKNIIDIFKKKPEPPAPIQIINVYSPLPTNNELKKAVDRKIANKPIIEPAKKNDVPISPVIVMPESEAIPDSNVFMSDDYLVDLAVDLNKKVRSGDRLIFIDGKYESILKNNTHAK